MRMRFRWSLLLVPLAVAIAGCGGEDVEPPPIPAAVEAGSPLTIEATDYLFSPNRVTIRGGAPSGDPETITLINDGELAHNIEILEGDRIVDRLRSFPAGQERSLEVALPPGSYRFICTVADHEQKGMTGTIEVRPRPAAK